MESYYIRSHYIEFSLLLLWMVGCSADPYGVRTVASPTPVPSPTEDSSAAEATGVRVRFHEDDVFTMKAVKSDTFCPGDVKNYYNPWAASGTFYSKFNKSALDSTTTGKPDFIKNISIDITNANYYQTANSSQSSSSNPYAPDFKNANDSCSYQNNTAVPSSMCAAFDHRLITGASTTWYSDPTATTLTALNTVSEAQLIYSTGTGYYKLLDQSFSITANLSTPLPTYVFSTCQSLGSTDNYDAEVSRRGVGGINVDIDRSKLNSNENLLLHVLFIPLGPDRNTNVGGTANTAFYPNGDDFGERAVFRVQLQSIVQSASALKTVIQPRNLSYLNQSKYPRIVKDLAILSRPSSQVREEQLLIPLSYSAAIDRIRIERIVGSAILLEAAVYRMGTK